MHLSYANQPGNPISTKKPSPVQIFRCPVLLIPSRQYIPTHQPLFLLSSKDYITTNPSHSLQQTSTATRNIKKHHHTYPQLLINTSLPKYLFYIIHSFFFNAYNLQRSQIPTNHAYPSSPDAFLVSFSTTPLHASYRVYPSHYRYPSLLSPKPFLHPSIRSFTVLFL